MDFALNHVTVARLGFAELVGLASELGCVGIELRNDLSRPLFDGLSPAAAGRMIRGAGLRLLSLAEIKNVDRIGPDRLDEVRAFLDIAHAAGAEAVSLIPCNDLGGANGREPSALRPALEELRPLLDERGLVGLVEPLGFATCALRRKADALAAIEALQAGERFRLVHDTFHHHLAGEGAVFPGQTGLVHISGVGVDLPPDALKDGHRGLVDGNDRLGNIGQITTLLAGGYDGPFSFEAFAPETHASPDPARDLRSSIDFIRSHFAAEAA